MKNSILVIFLLISLINIFSCTPANILATGGATGMVIAEGDRSIGTVVDDATIKINIAAKFINSSDNLFIDLNTNIFEGRVLLTGVVSNQEIRIEAVRKVWEVEGVNEIVNEIQIGDKSTIKEYAQDLWINTQVKGMAAKTLGLRAVAYNFETIKGKVYIAGITSRPEQLKNLIEGAKTIKGVIEIVNYVIVK